MKFESIIGKASIYVYQDFWTQILIYNMIQGIRKSGDEEIFASRKQNSNKYLTNENIAIGLFKESMIKLLSEMNPTKRAEKLKKLQKEIEKFILPIREFPSRERKTHISSKYSNNQKIVFKCSYILLMGNIGIFVV